MTIDEAIAHARASIDKNGSCWLGCHGKSCRQCLEEHKQIAEWLEELKDHRERECNHINEALYDKGYSDGYNNAIDDFVNACKEDILCQTFGLHQNGIEKITEQLKAGG